MSTERYAIQYFHYTLMWKEVGKSQRKLERMSADAEDELWYLSWAIDNMMNRTILMQYNRQRKTQIYQFSEAVKDVWDEAIA